MSISDFRYIPSYKMDISVWTYRKLKFSAFFFRFPICPFRYVHFIAMDISEWTYRKWWHQRYRKYRFLIYSDFRYIQTDMSIFSYGYIGNGHIENDVIKCIDFRYVHFRYTEFPINQSFYPLPTKLCVLCKIKLTKFTLKI